MTRCNQTEMNQRNSERERKQQRKCDVGSEDKDEVKWTNLGKRMLLLLLRIKKGYNVFFIKLLAYYRTTYLVRIYLCDSIGGDRS